MNYPKECFNYSDDFYRIIDYCSRPNKHKLFSNNTYVGYMFSAFCFIYETSDKKYNKNRYFKKDALPVIDKLYNFVKPYNDIFCSWNFIMGSIDDSKTKTDVELYRLSYKKFLKTFNKELLLLKL